MKDFKNIIAIMMILALAIACSDDDDVKDPGTTDPGTSSSELLAKKVTTAPKMDGVIDAIWSECQVLENTVKVPSAGIDSREGHVNEGRDFFFPFVGETADFKMRAMYDAENLYILLEWDDAKDSYDRQSWYFADGAWSQQNKFPATDDDRYYEDKIGVMWAAAGMDNWGGDCYETCHMGLDLEGAGGGLPARHYTNNDGEYMDMWHWKRVRTAPFFKLDDKYMRDNDDIGSGHGGRQADGKTAGGYINNKVKLYDGTDSVNVPLYIISGQEDYDNGFITQAQINAGTALEVVAVDAAGVLTLSDDSTIDPSAGGFEKNTGTQRIPSVYGDVMVGGRADVSVYHSFTGSGWITEITRKLSTEETIADADGYVKDVQFNPANEYGFGLALFNNAAVAHQIKTNLLLKFEE